MDSHADRATIGDDTLDSLLRGGLPRGFAYLITGEHGTGKTTLGMQFLQAGLESQDRALFVGIDQTLDQLQTTFEGYDWTLTDEDLAVTALSAQPGTVDGHQALTLNTMGTDDPFDAFHPGATSEILTRYITQFAPVDRVVLDGIDTLATLHDAHSFTRTFVDILRLVTRECDATTLFTTASAGQIDPVPSLVHGSFSLSRDRREASHATTFQVTHVHGVEYDPRPVDLQFSTAGVRGAPRRRGLPASLAPSGHVSVGIPGIDELTGGGLVAGKPSLLTHDGTAIKAPLVAAFIAAFHEQDYAVTLLPSLDLGPSSLVDLLDAHDLDLQSLLTAGELYIVDFTGAWDAAESNVYGATDDRSQLEGVLREVDELTAGRRATIASADVLSHTFSASDVRTLRYYQEGQLLSETDLLLHLLNPGVIGPELQAFFTETASQVMSLTGAAGGRTHISLDAGPSGAIGATALLEYGDEPPFATVDAPPLDDRTASDG